MRSVGQTRGCDGGALEMPARADIAAGEPGSAECANAKGHGHRGKNSRAAGKLRAKDRRSPVGVAPVDRDVALLRRRRGVESAHPDHVPRWPGGSHGGRVRDHAVEREPEDHRTRLVPAGGRDQRAGAEQSRTMDDHTLCRARRDRCGVGPRGGARRPVWVSPAVTARDSSASARRGRSRPCRAPRRFGCRKFSTRARPPAAPRVAGGRLAWR